MMKRLTFMALLMALMVVLVGCGGLTAQRPDASGNVYITLRDYAFSPRQIRVKAGQRVSLVITNQGDHLHELMIGRNVQVEDGFTEGFAEDFFAGITPEVQGPGMIMGLEGMEMDMAGMDMSGGSGQMDMGGDGHEEGKDDAGMDMSGDSGQMDMGGDGHDEGGDGHEEGKSDAGMDMSGDSGQMDMGGDGHDEGDGHGGGAGGKFGAISRAAMGEHHGGLMVMIDPLMIPKDQATVLTFTVPEDKVGEWELGCFQERGQHYDDGMRGVLIVEP